MHLAQVKVSCHLDLVNTPSKLSKDQFEIQFGISGDNEAEVVKSLSKVSFQASFLVLPNKDPALVGSSNISRTDRGTSHTMCGNMIQPDMAYLYILHLQRHAQSQTQHHIVDSAILLQTALAVHVYLFQQMCGMISATMERVASRNCKGKGPSHKAI